nr:reverse transcriptase domain-containing protein [Tanacetum cinerariifolium]
MAEMLRAPTEGCAEAIVVPSILAEQFELKHRAACRWLEKEPPRSITTWDDLVSKFINEFFPPSRTTNLRNEISDFQQKFDESFHEAWERYKDLLRACPHHGFTELHQLDTFYNALNPADQDSLNAAAGGNLLEKSPQDALTIIENKSKVRNSQSKLIASSVNACDINSSSEIAKLTHAVNQQTSAVTTAMTAMLKQLQANPPLAQVKAVEEICVTCGGAHPYYQCLTAGGNTFPEFRDNIQGYVLAAAGNYNQGNPGYRPQGVANQMRPPGFAQPNVQNNQNRFGQPQGFNRTTKFNQEQPYQATTQSNKNFHLNELEKIKRMNDVSLKAMQNQIDMVKNELRNEMKTSIQTSLTNQTNEIKNMMASLYTDEHRFDFKVGISPEQYPVILKKLPEKLGDPGKFLIPCGFSELKCKALADIGASINLMPLSVWKKLGLPDLIPTRMTLELANRAICTPDGIARDVFVPVGKFTFLADFVVVDYESDPRVPLILGRPFLRTTRALIDIHGEETILRNGDERLTLNMKHDTTSYSNHPHRESVNLINIFNVPSEDCLEVSVSNKQSGNPTFSLHKEITSPGVTHELHDSERCTFLSAEWPDIDSFNDIHPYFDDDPLSGSTTYSSNSLLEEFTDELALITYPLDYDDNLTDDDLPSPDNEDKVFNPGILIHKKLVTIITYVAQEKKLAISYASLMFEDFDPPFYKLLVFKDVPNSMRLLPFSSENEEKVFKPGIYTSEKVKENQEKDKIGSTPEKKGSAVQSESPVLTEPVIAPVSASKPNPKASIPYPSRRNDERNHEKANNQIKKFYQIFKDMSFEISFADSLILMPKFASTLKALIGNKEKLSEMSQTPLNEHCFAVLLKKLLEKLGDQGKILIPCDFSGMAECLALADLGASINLISLSVWKKLSLPDLTPTCITLELADHSISRPVGVAEDVYVKVGSFHFPADFVVVDFDANPRVPLILERSFLKTGRDLIDAFKDDLTLRVGKEAIIFNLDQTLRYSANYSDMTAKRIDVIDMACEEYSQEVLGFFDTISSGSYTPYHDLIISATSPTLTPFGNSDFLLEEELKIYEAKTDKSLVDEPPAVELKTLPPQLKYAFLEGDGKLPVIIAKDLSVKEKTALITVIKLLDTGLIYPIFDSPWVSPVHCVPKKGGFTIVENEDNELISTRLVTCWRVCIDYRKLNEATRKDYFPLAFMDQMLERLAGNQYYCFLEEKMLKRCEDTNLCLNWEKSYFIVKEGILLGHKISKQGIEVDKAKVDVITKLPHPTTVKEGVYLVRNPLISSRLATLDQPEVTMDQITQPERKIQINELNELRDQAYENSLIFKEKTKRIHDSKIKNRVFNIGDRVLLFNSRLKIFSGKLKSRWSGPFTISQVFPYDTVELSQPDEPNFKVNG